MAAGGGPGAHPCCEPGKRGTGGGVGGRRVFGLCAGGTGGSRLDGRHRGQAGAATLQGVCLLWGSSRPPKVHGPHAPAHKCSPGSIPSALVAFVEVTAEHTIPGKGVWLVVPINMWQPEQAATMFHAAALRRGPVAQWSN